MKIPINTEPWASERGKDRNCLQSKQGDQVLNAEIPII